MTSLELLSLLNVLLLLSAHFVADFLLQSDWMATNKSKDWLALLSHTGLYSITMTAAFWMMTGADFMTVVAFNSLTWVTHTLTDAITSRITNRLWFFRREDGIWECASFVVPKHNRTIVNPFSYIDGNRRHWFFVVIGLDQLIHAWTLVLTFAWVLR